MSDPTIYDHDFKNETGWSELPLKILLIRILGPSSRRSFRPNSNVPVWTGKKFLNVPESMDWVGFLQVFLRQ